MPPGTPTPGAWSLGCCSDRQLLSWPLATSGGHHVLVETWRLSALGNRTGYNFPVSGGLLVRLLSYYLVLV
jgi:hypothetical protein